MKNVLDRLEELSPERRELLEKLLKQQGKQFNTFPVSFAQQRMWVLEQIAPETAAYIIPVGLRLHGPLHRLALERALSEIVARHEALRTVFPAVGGRPVQVVQPPSALSLSPHDLSHLSQAEREAQVVQLVEDAIHQPFDLATGPLWRGSLLRLATHEHVLLLSIHHIVFDGWSLGLLLHELAQLYDAFVLGQPSPLPALSVQYADYSQWQREWLQGPLMQEHQAFWREQLQGPLPTLDLPTDHPRPPVQTLRGAEYPFRVPQATASALKILSVQEGATLFMTLLAGFSILLWRYSGQSALLIGTPVANRTRAEVEELIGCFINTLVLRADLSQNPSLRQVLRRVQQVALHAYAHQDLPFEQIVEELHLQRDLSRSPLFQVMFALQNAPQPPVQFRDVTVSLLPTPMQSAKFDLSLFLWETEDGLGGCFEYNTDLFEESTIVRMSEHLQAVLHALAQVPDQRLSELTVLTAQEQALILRQWNDTGSVLPTAQCVHQLIEAQVARTPDAVAVLLEEEQLTYRQLNERANQVAHYLHRLEVGPEVVVGVCMSRSLEMIIGLLGILKAGGAYLPLDPAYTQERLAFMLQDTQASLVLTDPTVREKVPPTQAMVICVGEEAATIAAEPVDTVASAVHAAHLAYIIYTSGSTGKPKGVMIEHRNAVAFLDWAQASFSPQELAGTLMATSICFDLSVFELFAPLSCGGTVIVAENALHLPTLPMAQRVTLINTVPSVMTELLRAGTLPPSVEVVNLAGEALPRSLVQQLYQQPSVKKVYNLYGPSEDTTYSTWALVERERQGNPPIGRPISNSQTYILDQHLQPVPIGVAGELYVGGAGLARGYLNRPGLTAEKFLGDPFSTVPGARLYRTGDLARYLHEGTIDYLGRADHQVKIRGFRIELGEIEAVLSQLPGIQEVVVQACEDGMGGKRLVAYVVAAEEVQSQVWREYLRGRLPEYMIPTVLMRLDALPLTANGKVDRRALPAPEQARSQAKYVAARTELEEQVARIWAQVLGLPRVGVLDNFFELGGHSLTAIQMTSRTQQALGVRVPLRSLFEDPTIAGLAQTVQHLLTQEDQVDCSLIQTSTRGEQNLENLLTYLEDLSEDEVQTLLGT